MEPMIGAVAVCGVANEIRRVGRAVEFVNRDSEPSTMLYHSNMARELSIRGRHELCGDRERDRSNASSDDN